jgi:polyisoprenyl-phosphate glycosyltransferase
MSAPVLSLVTPAFNEAGNLSELYRRIVAALAPLNLAWEWIVVDDHSRDDTFAALADLARADRRVVGVRLARNGGAHAAILCGLARARGEAAIVLAADLEDPPEEIARLVDAWRAGAEIVWAARRARPGRSLLERAGSRLFHTALRRMAGLDHLPPSGADFFLAGRRVLEALKETRERNLNVMALLAWLGFRQAAIEYDKGERAHGRSGWTWRAKMKLLVDSVTAFSYRPIRLMSWLGIALAAAGFLYAGVVVVNAIVGRPTEGWSSLMIAVLVIGGAQMLMLGVLGEYLWRTLDEARGRPRWVIEAATDEDTAPTPRGENHGN